MATSPAELAPSFRASQGPAPQPDYSDEVTREQIKAICKLVDPDGTLFDRSKVLHAPAW